MNERKKERNVREKHALKNKNMRNEGKHALMNKW
jgi:hypothetical protein